MQQMPCNGGHLAPYLYVVGYIDQLLRSAVYSATWRLHLWANVSLHTKFYIHVFLSLPRVWTDEDLLITIGYMY